MIQIVTTSMEVIVGNVAVVCAFVKVSVVVEVTGILRFILSMVAMSVTNV